METNIKEEQLNTILPTLEDIEGGKKAKENLLKSKEKRNSNKTEQTSLSLSKILGNIFNGTFLTSESSNRQWPFVIFLAFVGMVYIANSYTAEKNVRKIDALAKEIKELHSQYITSKAEIMYSTKQSEIAKLSAQYGILETKEAPYKILMK